MKYTSNMNNVDSSKNETKHGTITLLDILGTKNLSIKDIQKFKKNIFSLYDRLDEVKKIIEDVDYGENTLLEGIINKVVILVRSAQLYNGNKEKDIQRLINFRYEIEIVTFSDTILIAIYPNDNGVDRDDWLLYYSSVILTMLFREMFANERILLRGAISIGDFNLFKKEKRMIFLGEPMFEAARFFENSNWAGIMTTPSAALILDQMNKTGNMATNPNSHRSDSNTPLSLESAISSIE
jgi:hypothetical protein